jgi:hypothetical protein
MEGDSPIDALSLVDGRRMAMSPLCRPASQSIASGGVDARMSSMCERGEPWKSCTVGFASVLSQDRSKPRKKSGST